MKQLFSTKLKIILVLTALVTAALSVVAGLTNRSLPDVLVQGLMTPFRSAATTLTNTVEKYLRITGPAGSGYRGSGCF